MRTNFYIDGFNLYKCCLHDTPHKWLNLVEFCRRSFPAPQNALNRVRYFTARVRAWPDDPRQPERQAVYLRALGTLPKVSITFGQFKTSRHWMKLVDPPAGGPTKALVERSEEKGSDVNLAVNLLADAAQDDYDAAVVLTNDPDQREAIHATRKVFGKRVVVMFPLRAGRHGSNVLKQVASEHRNLDLTLLSACQFPRVVTDAKGRPVHKPASW